jgi:hypothetical protein
MPYSARRVHPSELTGPRSYFTDLDPNDPNFEVSLVVRKLKLQLLTKEKVIIAASSLFHDVGLEVCQKDQGLIEALEKGILLPAIRNQFGNVEVFFRSKSEYSKESERFFKSHVRSFVIWDLEDNVNWFKSTFFSALNLESSVLRKRAYITQTEAESIIQNILELSNSRPVPIISREDIAQASKELEDQKQAFLRDYTNLIYRLSGARAVNSEGHFPQSNLTNLNLVENEKLLSEESLFWDIYVEAVTTYLNQAVYLMPDRLDRLSFSDILKIRNSLFSSNFAKAYDQLLSEVKSSIDLSDPDKLILHMEEINSLASKLHEGFKERIWSELSRADTDARENALFQVANILSLFNPTSGLIIGTVSALKSLPEITVAVSPEVSESMNSKMRWAKDFINSRIGWSPSSKKSLIDAYKELVTYGLPK